MSVNNAFTLYIEGLPLFPETFPLDPLTSAPPLNEIALQNSQLERLSLDVHIQSLCVEIECAKWQKLSSTLKRVRRDLISSNRISIQLRHDIYILRERVRELQYMYDDKIARIGTVSYGSLARIHQLLISLTPYIPQRPIPMFLSLITNYLELLSYSSFQAKQWNRPTSDICRIFNI